MPPSSPKYKMPRRTIGEDSVRLPRSFCHSTLPRLALSAVILPDSDVTNTRSFQKAGDVADNLPICVFHFTLPVSASTL